MLLGKDRFIRTFENLDSTTGTGSFPDSTIFSISRGHINWQCITAADGWTEKNLFSWS